MRGWWNTVRERLARVGERPPIMVAVLLAGTLVAVHAAAALLPMVFEPLQAQAIDQLFRIRAALDRPQPAGAGAVVHVLIDDAGIRRREGFYFDRGDMARLVRNLDRAGVDAQMLDMIFAAPQTDTGDRELEDALRDAKRTYVGMALGLGRRLAAVDATALSASERRVLDSQAWTLGSAPPPEETGLDRPGMYFVTFPQLAGAARGMGFLDVTPDRDGVLRRVALLALDGDRFFPLLPLRLVADHLGVTPDRIVFRPGRSLTLRGARTPGSTATRDIVIPVDERGRMIVDFRGPWEDETNLYPFTPIWEASDDRFLMEDLREELAGKIAVVAWFGTGLSDLSPVPTDRQYPRSGVWTTTIASILDGDFLREAGGWTMLLLIELPVLALLWLAATRLGALPLIGVAAGLLAAYAAVVATAFLAGGLILQVPVPAMTLGGGTVLAAAYGFHIASRARARLHRELDVARQIQLGTLPSTMPAIPGYDVAGESRPADQTGGDSFDVVPLPDGRAVLLLGDATGHGIGPALSVTQVRSMLRVALRLDAGLDDIVTQINDQLEADLASNRFVTAFFGLLDPAGHRITYHAAGQGPLLHLHAATGECDEIGASGLALGMMSGLPLKPARTMELAPGDVVGLMSDGIFEQENRAGEQFGVERVVALLRKSHHLPAAEVVGLLYRELGAFQGRAEQADDVTILLVRRDADGG